MPPARPRLSDVAALAGVSQKTVSNVINDYPHVTERTRLKVEAALRELNYRVNIPARSLASGRTGFIALAVPSLDNPYFSELAVHVMAAAAAYRWTVLIEQTGGSPDAETLVVDGAMPYLVDGIVLHLRSLTPADLRNRSDSTPLVLIGEKTPHHIADYVAGDSVQAAYDLTTHLLRTGRTRVAVIGIERDTRFATSTLRFEGYRRALADAGIDVRDDYVVPVERFQRENGAIAMGSLLALPEPPDAVLCFNDLLALGALSHLNTVGVAVPRDVALAGFDDIDESAYSSPPLTTIAWDTKAIAERAVALLAERLSGDSDSPPREISVDYTVVQRQSTTLS
ncbi:LacI family DNA-binding transcriptional regulator [Planctomonas psychrotolerans]|uniref:LacI family DNA-binding transcriptional regulator n=1 Tax=Planctomonas psychrotolerans TaxID=2528712 RepID=UPI00123B4CFF|nr:LacI family DNA-binding transcriptional regulator [Planctomonas psychrotolerans]